MRQSIGGADHTVRIISYYETVAPRSPLFDRSGVLWLVTPINGGLVRYSPCQYRFKLYRHNPLDSNSLSGNYARGIIEDTNYNPWIGIQGGGLNKIDRRSGIVTATTQPTKAKCLSGS